MAIEKNSGFVTISESYMCEDGSTIIMESRHNAFATACATAYRYNENGELYGSIEFEREYKGDVTIYALAHKCTSKLWEFARFAGTSLTDESDERADLNANHYRKCSLDCIMPTTH